MSLTIGEQLKEARQKRGLTLEQAAQSTHIRKHYLEALENDQREALPSAVQGRGFLRLYAGLLNLPTAPLLAAWEGKPEPPPVEVASLPDAGNEEATAQSLPEKRDSTLIASGESTRQESPQQPVEPALPALEQVIYNQVEDAASDQATGYRLIFREIGQQLRAQREALGLSLTEVERYTRLRTFYVQAMEEGRIDDLPSPVQGRGMLSNYAAFLNLDEEKLLLRFAEGLQARRIERLPKPEPQSMFNQKKRPARQAPIWKRFLTPDLIFGVGLASIILFFALWTASRITSMRNAEAKPTAPAIAEILLTQEALKTGTPGEGTLESGTPAAEIPVVEGTPVAPSETTPLSENPIQPGTAVSGGSGNLLPATNETPSGTATLPPINDDPLQIYIVARQRAWLRIITDDKVKFLGRVVPGNAYAYTATKRIELSTGNAGALQVFYNQIDLGTLGNSGDVANLVFSIEGVYTPTPAFTATSTPTKPATLTPIPSPTPPATATITPLVP